MRKSGLIVFALLLLADLASAQVPSGNVFFGYSYYNTDLSSIDRANTNGWEASVEGKILPFIGFVADFDAHYGSQNFQGACIAGFATTCGRLIRMSLSTIICLVREFHFLPGSFVHSRKLCLERGMSM
jgi:hypothetical protein